MATGCIEDTPPKLNGTPFLGDVTMRGAAVWFQAVGFSEEQPEAVVLDSS